MPRKKAAKSAARKKQSTRQVKNPVSNLQKLENDFSAAIAKLAEQLIREVVSLKSKENKLNTALTKIQAQIKKIEKSIIAAASVKTSAGRKQLAAAKKVLNDTKKDQALSIAALKETTLAIADAEARSARSTALAKALRQFDKDWAKEVKKLKDKAKAKANAEAKAKKAKAASKRKAKARPATRHEVERTQPPALTVIEQPNFENTVEEAEFEDLKQVIS